MISMIINAAEKNETRIAVIEDGILDEYYVERTSKETLVGNMYRGKVENVHPSLQSAFVNIGLEKNGFLHASETRDQSSFLKMRAKGGKRKNGESAKSKSRKPKRTPRLIQDALKIGQEVLVQVTRDEFGDKGPSLTMDISLPGRFLVLTPTSLKLGVSKKIKDDEERTRLKKLLQQLSPPELLGFIIRTTGTDTTKADLNADLSHLVKLWDMILDQHAKKTNTPLLYQEADLSIRTVRDVFNSKVEEIVVDDSKIYRKLLDFFSQTMAKYQGRVKYYSGGIPIFNKYKVESQIEQLSQKILQLPSGGSVVIEQTEALISIDVNSGRYTRETSPEETAYRTNLEAAKEVMRQFRLRDLGGIVVIDFIDMRLIKHRKAVQNLLYRESKRDKSQISILPISQFCLGQIARQKIRPSLRLVNYDPCPSCHGYGFVKSVESIGLELLRMIRSSLANEDVAVVDAHVNAEVAGFLEAKKEDLDKIQEYSEKRIHINVNKASTSNSVELICYSNIGEVITDLIM